MPIDIIYCIVLGLAIWKGWNKGLIVAIFSFFALLIGLAAALKMSSAVAKWLQLHTHISGGWLPFVAFVLIFIAILLSIRMVAAILEKSVELMLMGWANKLGGIVLYGWLYTLIFSVVLFFAVQLSIFTTNTLQSSKCYAYIIPMGPRTMDGIGKIVPLFKNLFTDLQNFFGTITA